MDITVTENAAKRIAELIKLSQEPQIALRVSVDGGGCSGFMYNYQLTNDINADDLVIDNNGIKVLIDPISQEFLKGCVVDFIQELGANYFKISNPNASAKCGCGNSFAV